MTRSLITYGFIALALVFLYLVKTRSRRPSTLYLVYTAAMTVGAVALLVYNVAGAIATDPPLRGSYIGGAIIVGFFVAGLSWALVRLARSSLQDRRR